MHEKGQRQISSSYEREQFMYATPFFTDTAVYRAFNVATFFQELCPSWTLGSLNLHENSGSAKQAKVTASNLPAKSCGQGGMPEQGTTPRLATALLQLRT